MDELTNPRVETPPYIKQVYVRDYAPLRKATVSFKRGLNIIIGKNGTGKTRFLTLLSELADLHENKKHYWGAGCRVVFGGVFGEKDEVAIEYEEQDDHAVIDEPLAWEIVPMRVAAPMTDDWDIRPKENHSPRRARTRHPPRPAAQVA